MFKAKNRVFQFDRQYMNKFVFVRYSKNDVSWLKQKPFCDILQIPSKARIEKNRKLQKAWFLCQKFCFPAASCTFIVYLACRMLTLSILFSVKQEKLNVESISFDDVSFEMSHHTWIRVNSCIPRTNGVQSVLRLL